jgi:hypothetical protein
VAAFARFVLELLALGAPADLVEEATRAIADETEHAKLCFAVASRYAGKPMGPATLDVAGALDRVSLESAVRSAVVEGCIGETLAAIEAAEAFEHAVDPAVKAVLSRIADDEARHAALAWRFVRWALERQGATLSRVATDAFEDASQNLQSRPSEGDHVFIAATDAELLAGGVLPAAFRRALRASAFEDVVWPCMNAVLGRPTGSFGISGARCPPSRTERCRVELQ